MGKLDVNRFRYISKEHLRMLTAVEMGMKNHAEVPESLVISLSGLRAVNHNAILRDLNKDKLIRRGGGAHPGFHLTSSGYDYLALRALVARGTLAGLGRRIGVGKEADLYLAEAPDGRVLVAKFARLGRTSFHNVRQKRDYLAGRRATNNLYLSRLAALKEFTYAQVLHSAGFPVPEPVDHNRHVFVMGVAEGHALNTVVKLPDAEEVAHNLLGLVVRLARHGLVHGDFNEFNLFVNDDGSCGVTMIDFPQMIATTHPNAAELFARDVDGVRRFFKSRFGVNFDRLPSWQADAAPQAVAMWQQAREAAAQAAGVTPPPCPVRLDLEAEASGASKADFTRIADMMIPDILKKEQEQEQEAESESESEAEAGSEIESEAGSEIEYSDDAVGGYDLSEVEYSEVEAEAEAEAEADAEPEAEPEAVSSNARAAAEAALARASYVTEESQWTGVAASEYGSEAWRVLGACGDTAAAAAAAGAEINGTKMSSAGTLDPRAAERRGRGRRGAVRAAAVAAAGTGGGSAQAAGKRELTAAQQAAIRRRLKAQSGRKKR